LGLSGAAGGTSQFPGTGSRPIVVDDLDVVAV
jgi:hypothetical protein